MAAHSPEARERYFKKYTTVVSVSAGSAVGSPYISHECPADSLRFAAIHFLIASCASFMRLYGPRWTATAASPPCVSVAYTSPAVSNVRVTSTPKSHSIGGIPSWRSAGISWRGFRCDAVNYWKAAELLAQAQRATLNPSKTAPHG